jgi:GNAT superfamily N-acetyltransferase
MTLPIRPLTSADAAAAIALIHLAFSTQSVQTDPPSSALRDTPQTIAAQIATGGGACAPTGTSLAGIVLWTERDGGLYVGRLAVAPAWRGRGIARALLTAAEQHATHRSLARVHLSTRLALLDNRRLFAAYGYHECELHAHPGYLAPTSVTMEKRLP